MACPEAALAFFDFNCNQFQDGKPVQFDSLVLHGLHDFKAEDGKVSCCLEVTEQLQNRYGTLHGGCIATLVDVVGSAALVTKLEYSGVSLNIAVNYYRPGAGGSLVCIVGEVIKIGKTVCSIEVTVSDKASGRIIAKGTHVKHVSSGEGKFPPLDKVNQVLTERREAARARQGKAKL